MRSWNRLLTACTLAASLASLAGCGKKVEDKNKDPGPSGAPGTPGAAPAQGAAPGVDPARKVIKLGALNDESGPAKQLGVAIANGKRLVVKAVKAGAVKLPDGWTIELVERDHGYNPQQSVQLYKEIRDQILLLATARLVLPALLFLLPALLLRELALLLPLHAALPLSSSNARSGGATAGTWGPCFGFQWGFPCKIFMLWSSKTIPTSPRRWWRRWRARGSASPRRATDVRRWTRRQPIPPTWSRST